MVEAALLGAAFIAGLVGTMAGFGTSTVFMALSLFFLDFQTALVLSTFLILFSNLSRVTLFRHGFNQGVIIFFGIPSILFVAVGALAVAYVPSAILEFILGLFLLGFSALSLWNPDFHFDPSERNALGGGAFSGFINGLIGTGGPVYGAFLMGFKMRSETYIATASVISLAMDLTRIPLYIQSGYLNSQYFAFIVPFIIIAVVSSYIGKKLVKRVSQEQFKKGVLVFLALVSLKFIHSGAVFLAGVV